MMNLLSAVRVDIDNFQEGKPFNAATKRKWLEDLGRAWVVSDTSAAVLDEYDFDNCRSEETLG